MGEREVGEMGMRERNDPALQLVELTKNCAM
jgi:hypothetical protein